MQSLKPYSRRQLLASSCAATTAILVAPVASSFVDSVSTSHPQGVTDRLAVASLRMRLGGGLFAARAAGSLAAYRAIGSAESTQYLFDLFQVSAAWKEDYSRANECTDNFRKQAQFVRSRQYEAVGAVVRSPLDQKVAVMRSYSSSTREVALSTQYGPNTPALTIMRREVDVVRAAGQHLRARQGLDDRVIAQAIALESRKEVNAEGVQFTAFGSPIGGQILHDRRPFRAFDLGTVTVHIDGITDPDNPPMLGLHT